MHLHEHFLVESQFLRQTGWQTFVFSLPYFSNQIDFRNHVTNPSTKVLLLVTRIMYHFANLCFILISLHLAISTVYYKYYFIKEGNIVSNSTTICYKIYGKSLNGQRKNIYLPSNQTHLCSRL